MNVTQKEKNMWEKGKKVGFKEGYDKAMSQLADMTEECKGIGRKEVVELLLANADYECEDEDGDTCITFWFKPEVWEKQLKEWNV